ncbi:MAG: DUF4268 domain-containing protein [Labrys sp. (in: a-proteobacteria)]
MTTLGRLVTVSVRDVWTHEANDFTPWLAKPENIAILAETLRLGEIEVEATEKDVGRFSADIVGRDEAGGIVLIENQLEATDHRHLGQVLTYLAGLEGEATIIWLATKFLEEHRAAVDWLNANTNDRFDFFGVEIEVLRIADSPPAPRFSVVAKPNNWSRGVGDVARRAAETPNNATQQFCLDHWTAFQDAWRAAGQGERFQKPLPRPWITTPIGRSGFKIHATLKRNDRSICVELFLRQKNDPTKHSFTQMLSQKLPIESQMGQALSWEELPSRIGSRIAVHRNNCDFDDRTGWPAQFVWMIHQIKQFRAVLGPYVKALVLEMPDYEDSEDDPDSETAG